MFRKSRQYKEKKNEITYTYLPCYLYNLNDKISGVPYPPDNFTLVKSFMFGLVTALVLASQMVLWMKTLDVSSEIPIAPITLGHS